MKRILIWVLVLLLLTGCGGKKLQTPTVPTELTEPPVTLYEPDSLAERSTGGAVRAYPLEGTYLGLEVMGSKLLLFSQEELTVLMGENCQIAATMLPLYNIYNVLADVSATGIDYVDSAASQLVVRNSQLQETQRVDLPQDMEGAPLVSLQRGEIFYVSGAELRSMDMETGISRLVKSQSCESQTLTGIWFNGGMVTCRVKEESGKEHTVYICTETGRTLSEDQTAYGLQTLGDRYLVHRQDGQVAQLIAGIREGDLQSFQPAEENEILTLSLSGIVSYVAQPNGLRLSYYDLATGKRAAQVQILNAKAPIAMVSDSQYVWLMAENLNGAGQTLYRWDVKRSPIADDRIYTGPLYTAENPDTEGLAQCQTLAQALLDTYGVRVRLWQDAVEQAGEWSVTGEHQVSVISAMLEEMEAVLSLFPGKFLSTTVNGGKICVNIMRQLPEGSWAQTWQEGDCCIYLTPEADIPAALLQGIGYAVDAFVLGNSRDYDDWNDLNPVDFSYTGAAQPEIPYLEGEDRYFVDGASAAYPHTDRSSIFAQALLPDNSATFQSAAMQAKLLRLCQAIRESYELEKSPDTYPWEQYLQTSLAYTK